MGDSPRYVPVVHAATTDRPDEADTLAAAEAVAGALSRLGFATDIVALDLDLTPLERTAALKPYAVFNLVEAMRGDDRLIAMVPMLLEHMNLAFTGAGSEAFVLSLAKSRTKQLLVAAGLPTPGWSMEGADCDPDVRYIVKADLQHGSLGMDAGSVVEGRRCAAEIASRSARHATRFFAERFVDGREFNVALIAAGGTVRLLPIQEIVFEGFADDAPRIVDYAAKWDPQATVYHTTPRRFGIERTDPQLAARLEKISRAAWQTFAMTGYARIDFRVDDAGAPFVLEVNMNPAITPDAGFAAAATETGIGYDALIGMIVDDAVCRNRVSKATRSNEDA
jgi:D-alanine-D-alanine ligase